MLDKQDLQAIKELIDTSIAASEQRTDAKLTAMEQHTDAKLTTMEQRIDAKLAAMEQRTDAKLTAMEQCTDAKLTTMEQRIDAKLTAMEQRLKKEVAQETMVMMEQYFGPKFNLLAENQQLILEKLDGKVDKENCQDSMSVVAAAIRAHGRDIDELKAQ